METKTITLSEPITVGGNPVTEITVRATTVGDEEDAMQYALSQKRGKNPLTVEMALFAKATKLPYDVLRSMSQKEYFKIRSAVNEVNGIEPAQDDDENPMTPMNS